MKPIIEIKGISKKYNITHQRGGYIALRDVLTTILKSPLRFLKQKAKNIAGVGTKEDFWALKDVSVSINQGEVVGIIGSNGAGKSTLLKILTGITPPTEGEIIMHGKVASLLEVGTGFHPELTGRENIFLNGAILGMTKKEIAAKFDEIVAFSGIEKFLDTPVKYYSSGMYVRLAFSVAAHMEPDILLVDEVLAVGDAEFQKKCLGKMEEVTHGKGRTILFVSHNMSAIQQLCQKSIYLKNGRIEMVGNTADVIEKYIGNNKSQAITHFPVNKGASAQISKISICDKNDALSYRISIADPFKIKIEFSVTQELPKLVPSVYFYSQGDLLLVSSETDQSGKYTPYLPGTYTTTVTIPEFLFNVGNYTFSVYIHNPYVEGFTAQNNLAFEILGTNNPRSVTFKGNTPGKIAVPLVFKTDKLHNNEK
jgi:lipopolysaccharide transport system ATP-binding protein